MKYYLDQTFNHYGMVPGIYEDARTVIYYDITFEPNGNWRSSTLYKVKYREGTCSDAIRYDAPFEYIFSNLTRKIEAVIEYYYDYNINNKHATFYSGSNPGTYEYFLLDELMLIRGNNGIIDALFEYTEDEEIELYGNSYNSRKFYYYDNISFMVSG